MANELALIILSGTGTNWDVERNHHGCICHVIALILGAGLKALNVSRKMVCPEKADKAFPSLAPIIKEVKTGPEDEIVEVIDMWTKKKWTRMMQHPMLLLMAKAGRKTIPTFTTMLRTWKTQPVLLLPQKDRLHMLQDRILTPETGRMEGLGGQDLLHGQRSHRWIRYPMEYRI
ncbi:hypothetical protein H4Q26_000351 [Puccinia striiformis f. sp. tritici PST-130]|nr:hypothetical protein H4Q26_000351 [Puccinia striiformis f. sp. tritici PST-130]